MWKPRGSTTGVTPGPEPPHEVSKFVGVLKRQWLLYDLSEDLPPTCWPFIIPKTSEKVSLILSCVKQNGLDGCTPPEILATVMGAVKQSACHVLPGGATHI